MKIIWDMIHFAIILILLYIIPIEVCFDVYIGKEISNFFSSFFAIDILINFNTSFFYKGFIVKNRKKIIISYLKSEFLIDICSLIFYTIDLTRESHFRFLKYLFMIRWKKLGKIYVKIQEKFKINVKIHPSVLDLINLLFFAFFILNIFACCWFYIGSLENSESWLFEKKITDESKITKYFYSIYWSTVTIMTVGYGDITATNLKEVIFSVFTVFFGCGIFAYFINSIGTIVQDIKKESSLFKYTKLIN